MLRVTRTVMSVFEFPGERDWQFVSSRGSECVLPWEHWEEKEPRRCAVALCGSCDDFPEDLFHEEVGWATQGVVRILHESRRGVFRRVRQPLRSGIRVEVPMHRMEWQIAVSMTMSASL